MWMQPFSFPRAEIIGVLDIPLLMTENESWTRSCLSAIEDSNQQNDGLQTVLETL